jgi:hypothetical protein
MAAKSDKITHPIKKRPSVVQIEDAIRKAAGNVTAAARGLGIGRTSLHARIAKSPELQRILQEERESLVDMAESALRAEVLDRNMTAVIWTLKASPEAKRRGWGERTELTGKDGGAVAFRDDTLLGLSDDDLRRNLAALGRVAALVALESGEPGDGDADGLAGADSTGEGE